MLVNGGRPGNDGVGRTITLKATVTDVLPATGLAYLSGEDGAAWTVTKSTPGAGLQSLKPGTQVGLKVERHDGFALVAEYATLD